jgi:hypothetical protein
MAVLQAQSPMFEPQSHQKKKNVLEEFYHLNV